MICTIVENLKPKYNKFLAIAICYGNVKKFSQLKLFAKKVKGFSKNVSFFCLLINMSLKHVTGDKRTIEFKTDGGLEENGISVLKSERPCFK